MCIPGAVYVFWWLAVSDVGLGILRADSPAVVILLTRQAVVLDVVTSFCMCATAVTASVHRHGNWVTEIICLGLCWCQSCRLKSGRSQEEGKQEEHPFHFCQDIFCVFTVTVVYVKRSGTKNSYSLTQYFPRFKDFKWTTTQYRHAVLHCQCPLWL